MKGTLQSKTRNQERMSVERKLQPFKTARLLEFPLFGYFNLQREFLEGPATRLCHVLTGRCYEGLWHQQTTQPYDLRLSAQINSILFIQVQMEMVAIGKRICLQVTDETEKTEKTDPESRNAFLKNSLRNGLHLLHTEAEILQPGDHSYVWRHHVAFPISRKNSPREFGHQGPLLVGRLLFSYKHESRSMNQSINRST